MSAEEDKVTCDANTIRDQNIAEGVRLLADKFNVNMERPRYGDAHKMLQALLHQVITLQENQIRNRLALDRHAARETELYRGAAVFLGGIATVTLPETFPAVVDIFTLLTGITIAIAPFTWPTEILHVIGGALIVIGMALVVCPSLLPSLLKRLGGGRA